MKSRAIPIIRLGDALIVSIQTQLSDKLVLALKEDIGIEIAQRTTRAIVIEISGVDIVDSFIAASIRDLAHVARLMGSETIVAGLDPAMAITLVEMGMTMKGVQTALNLDAAIGMLERERTGEAAHDIDLWQVVMAPDRSSDADLEALMGVSGGKEV